MILLTKPHSMQRNIHDSHVEHRRMLVFIEDFSMTMDKKTVTKIRSNDKFKQHIYIVIFVTRCIHM